MCVRDGRRYLGTLAICRARTLFPAFLFPCSSSICVVSRMQHASPESKGKKKGKLCMYVQNETGTYWVEMSQPT